MNDTIRLMNKPTESDQAWFVYIVKCYDRTLYTGITKDVLARVEAHNKGDGAKYTRSRRPVELVWYEKVEGESTARKREYAIKQLSRKQKLALIEQL